jgi:glutamine cyclotransferase
MTACSGSSGSNGMVPNKNINPPTAPLPVYGYEVVKTYPHDSKAFTQGLLFHNGFLYESTGQEGKSSLRRVEIETGKVLQKVDQPEESFAEGIALLNDKIYQLTWEEGLCRVFGVNDFTLVKQFDYQGEGWGLTTDGKNLFMTDRTHVIRVMDPETFKPVRMLTVLREDGKPLMQINELEYVNGEIWANVWHSEEPRILGKPNYIARIDPNSGKLLGWINLYGISPDDVERDSENTLNGIAYDAATDRIFVTGKKWKKLFEIKIKPPVTN